MAGSLTRVHQHVLECGSRNGMSEMRWGCAGAGVPWPAVSVDGILWLPVSLVNCFVIFRGMASVALCLSH